MGCGLENAVAGEADEASMKKEPVPGPEQAVIGADQRHHHQGESAGATSALASMSDRPGLKAK